MQSICNDNYNMSVSRDPFFSVSFHSNIIRVSSMALEENIALSSSTRVTVHGKLLLLLRCETLQGPFVQLFCWGGQDNSCTD